MFQVLARAISTNYIYILLLAAMAGFALYFVIKRNSEREASGSSDGTPVSFDPVGEVVCVSATIAPNRFGKGEISCYTDGKFFSMNAVTEGEEMLSMGESVKILKMENGCAVVERW